MKNWKAIFYNSTIEIWENNEIVAEAFPCSSSDFEKIKDLENILDVINIIRKMDGKIYNKNTTL